MEYYSYVCRVRVYSWLGLFIAVVLVVGLWGRSQNIIHSSVVGFLTSIILGVAYL